MRKKRGPKNTDTLWLPSPSNNTNYEKQYEEQYMSNNMERMRKTLVLTAM